MKNWYLLYGIGNIFLERTTSKNRAIAHLNEGPEYDFVVQEITDTESIMHYDSDNLSEVKTSEIQITFDKREVWKCPRCDYPNIVPLNMFRLGDVVSCGSCRIEFCLTKYKESGEGFTTFITTKRKA